MKSKFFPNYIAILVLSIILLPITSFAESRQIDLNSIQESIDELDLDNLNISLNPIEKIPLNSNSIEFDSIEEFQEFLINLNQDIKLDNIDTDQENNIVIETFENGEWVTVDSNYEIKDESKQSNQPMSNDYYKSYKATNTLTDRSWAGNLFQHRVQSVVHYDVELMSPYCKVPRRNYLREIASIGTDMKYDYQTATATGPNLTRIMVEYEYSVYTNISVKGFPFGFLLDGFEGVWYIY